MEWHGRSWENSTSILTQHVCLFMASEGLVWMQGGGLVKGFPSHTPAP